jgi:hypothetical protein
MMSRDQKQRREVFSFALVRPAPSRPAHSGNTIADMK